MTAPASAATDRLPRSSTLLLSFAYLLLVAGAAIAATGGGAWRIAGGRVSMTTPGMPLAVGGGLLVAAAVRRRARLLGDLATAWPWLERRGGWIAAYAAAALLAFAIDHGTFAASGSDASGYVSQAALLARGALVDREPLAAVEPWPDAVATLTPLGYRQGPAPGTLAPTYAPGLPLTMAAAMHVGGDLAAYLVVPMFAGAMVWSTWRLGALVVGPVTGLVAALWLASTPITLFQSQLPMSDVPVAAWWTMAALGVVVGTPVGLAGAALAAGAALLTRPNLLPLAVVLLGATWLPNRQAGLRGLLSWQTAVLLAGIVPAGVAVLWWQHTVYGSATASGYGEFGELFTLANVGANTRLYARWLTGALSPVVWLAPVAPWVIARFHGHRTAVAPAAAARNAGAAAWVGLTLIVVNVACYLPYAVFENWTYARFLLPAAPIALLLASSVIVGAMRRMPPAAGVIALALLVPALALRNITWAAQERALDVRDRDERHALAGRYLSGLLPANAVIVAGEHSGSARFYARRPVLRWDLATPDTWRAAIDALAARRRPIVFVVDEWEEAELRRRLGVAAPLASLDWPPMAEAGRAVRTRIYAAADRAPFLAGRPRVTDRLR